jgi:hypothetical protein
MKKTLLAIVIALLCIGTFIFAQSKPDQKSTQPAASDTMSCPMMGMMSQVHDHQMQGQMQHSMPAMMNAMAGMFSLSAEEISTLLSEKKTDVGLTDAQVKLVAGLIASSQQKKADEKMHQMHQMMAQKQGEGMKCPCMEKPEK